MKLALKRLREIYAPHVKRFKLVLGFPEDYYFKALCNGGRTNIFPKLTRVEIGLARMSGHLDEFARCVLGPAVRDVQITLHAPLSNVSDCVGRTSRMIRTSTSVLERLSFKAESEVALSSLGQEELSQTIASFPTLLRLEVARMQCSDEHVFSTASQLRGLRELALVYHGSATSPPSAETFPSLAKLKAEVTPASLPHLLSSISSGSLQEIKLLVDRRHQAQRILSPGCFTAVEHFASLATVELALGPTLQSWNDLLPFLSCKLITRFRLECRIISSLIDNNRLNSMALAWSHLNELDFQNLSHFWEENPQAPLVTLQGLTCLAERCRALKKLRISVDARHLPDEVAAPAVSLGVKEVHLDNSLADEREDQISVFISKMWPNLENGVQTSHRINPTPGSQHDRWTRIQGKVKGLNLGLQWVVHPPANGHSQNQS